MRKYYPAVNIGVTGHGNLLTVCCNQISRLKLQFYLLIGRKYLKDFGEVKQKYRYEANTYWILVLIQTVVQNLRF